MTLDEVISYNRLFADMETKSGDLEIAEYYRDTVKCLEELKELRELKAEYKRLLKAAVEDFAFVSENFINNMDSFCSMYNHISGCAKGCSMSGSDDYGRCKWRYADEALKLLNDEK